MVGFQMIGTIARDKVKAQPFEKWTLWNPTFKQSRYQMFPNFKCSKGLLLFENQTKWSSFGMSHLVFIFENWNNWNLILKKSRFQMFPEFEWSDFRSPLYTLLQSWNLFLIVQLRVSQPGLLEPQGVSKNSGATQKVQGYANYDFGSTWIWKTLSWKYAKISKGMQDEKRLRTLGLFYTWVFAFKSSLSMLGWGCNWTDLLLGP